MSENLFGLTVAADKGLDDLQCQRLLSENRRYQEVMLQYRCALKALVSRLEILNEEFSLQHDRNPIESKIYRSTAPGLPVAAYDDLSAFKIYLVDVGLLRRLAQLAPTAFGEGNRLFTEFKGALTENFVLQTLITQFEVVPRYWSQNNPPYEVDFLIQRENDIFPVEVKSEANTTSKSLKKFKELFPDQVKLRVRFSLDNLKLDDDVLNIPLFMADQADRLIGLALEKKNSFGQ